MVSKYDIKQWIKKRQKTGEFDYIYNDENESIYDENGNLLYTLDDFLKEYRKKYGQSFESIYYEHVSLQNVLRCTECGTVIFTTEDESYDDNLRCPTCTDYHTCFEYWTKEEIEADKSKQESIKAFEEMTAYQKEKSERIKKRNGKYDWEIANKKFYGKKIFLEFSLECDNIVESYFKGLRLLVYIGKKDDNGIGYTVRKCFKIPLSWLHLY